MKRFLLNQNLLSGQNLFVNNPLVTVWFHLNSKVVLKGSSPLQRCKHLTLIRLDFLRVVFSEEGGGRGGGGQIHPPYFKILFQEELI